MVDISICIPVYNSEKYLKECIESILSQCSENIEIILVDDGSTDKSGIICDAYADNYSNIHTLHKSNGGVSDARNAAIEFSSGKWIAFVDSDDKLAPCGIKIMSEYVSSDADVISFSFKEIQRGTSLKPDNDKYEIGIFEDKRIDLYLAENFHHIIWKDYNFSHVCGKMFKRQLITENNILFEKEITHGEDTVFSFYCESCSNKIIVDTRCVYFAIYNKKSSTESFCPDIAQRYNNFVEYAKRALIEKNKWNNEIIVRAFYCHVVYIIKMAMRLGPYHPNCRWNKKRRIKWLEDLLSFQWVMKTAEYNNFGELITDENKKLLELMRTSCFYAIDNKWKIIKIRKGILRICYSTKTGTKILTLIKRLRKS